MKESAEEDGDEEDDVTEEELRQEMLGIIKDFGINDPQQT